MKLLVDMNLSPRWIELLSQAGFEAAHWSMMGPVNASDVRITIRAEPACAFFRSFRTLDSAGTEAIPRDDA